MEKRVRQSLQIWISLERHSTSGVFVPALPVPVSYLLEDATNRFVFVIEKSTFATQ